MNEFAVMHDAMKAYCDRHDRDGWPDEAIKFRAHRVRLYLWELANNDSPVSSALEGLARETEALAKARGDT